jgi:IMP dehydrogenase/GMP reductase
VRDFSNIPTCLSFDDIMIVPTYSEIKSRSEPITKTRVGSISLDLPIVSSPMDTVTEYEMAVAISRAGGMGLIHRFMSPRDQGLMLRRAFDEIEESIVGDQDLTRNTFGTIGAAIGVGQAEFDRLKTIIDISGVDRFTTLAIDVANGFSSYMKDMIEMVRSSYGDSINIIAGNIATGEGFDFLSKAGANAIRGGIGGGCFTPGTKVLTNSGLKPIEEIIIGDMVLTHTASWKPVVNTLQFERDEEIVVINGIESTKNHEYYVIKKSDSKLITEDNIHQYAFWIEADHLDEREHLLIELD